MKSSRTIVGFLALLALLLVVDSDAFAQRGSAGRSSAGASRSRASTPSRAPQRSRASTPSRAPQRSRASTPSRAPQRSRASTPSRAPQRSRASTPSRSSPSRTASPSSVGRRSYSPSSSRGSSRTATPTRTTRGATSPRSVRGYDSSRSSNARGSSNSPRTTTPIPAPSASSATRGAARLDRVYDSGRTGRTSRTAPTGNTYRTPENTGRSRFDRYTSRDASSGTTRFVRVDGDKPSAVLDLTGSAAPRRTRAAIPRLRGSSTPPASRLGSARFEPRTEPRTNAAARVRTSRIRTSPITRDSVLKRYNKPDRSIKAGPTKQPSSDRIGRGQRLRGEASGRTRSPQGKSAAKNARTSLSPELKRGKSVREFDSLAKKNPALAGKIDKAAFNSARVTDLGLKVGINAGLAIGGASVGLSFYDDDFASPGPYYGPSYDCGTDYNFWNSYGCWSLGYAYYNCFPYTGFCYSFGYSNCYPSWCGYRSRFCNGFPFFYSSAFAGYYGGFDEDEYEDGFQEGFDRGFDSGLATGDEFVQEGEAVIRGEGERGRAAAGTRLVPSSSEVNKEALTRAAAHYLSVGDSAFLDKRYGDAVHFYAKAIEFAPDEGVLYLILSDALFATGDYHYAAYALRKALELDPALMDAIDDKHSFYRDPADFDQQVAVLELFLEDHYVDDDARLLLASNYLFGNRPAAAVDLLENSFSKSVRESQSGQLILAAAKSIQYGTPSED